MSTEPSGYNVFEVTLSTTQRYILITLNILVSIIGILGNILIIVYFSRSKKYRDSLYRYFLLHLAFADLLCCSVVPITKVPVLFTHGRWVVGDFACRVLKPVSWMLTGCSGWILCGLCWDRCKAISQPLNRRLTRKQISIYCGSCWLATMCLCIPYIWFSKSDGGKCNRLFAEDDRIILRYFDIVKDFVKGYIPITVMIVFLLKIYFSLKRRRVELSSNISMVHTNHVSIRKLEKNTQFTVITTSAFVIFFLPSTILNCVVNLAFNNPPIIRLEVDTLERLDIALGWMWALTYLNSAINCFIYAGRFKDFQIFLKTFKIS